MILRKKLIVMILCGILLLFLFSACDSNTKVGIISSPDGPTEVYFFNENDENNIIISADIPDREYYVIRSDYAPRDETNSAVKLRKALEEFTESTIGITTDWEKNPVYEYELIVGKTLRETDENVNINRIELGETGFVIRAVNNKVYISGGDIKGTDMAVDYFISTFITDNNTGKVIIPKDYDYKQYHQYDIPEFYIGGTLIDNSYVIQCMDVTNKSLAEALQSNVYYKTGLWLEIITGTELGNRKPAFVLSNIEPKVKGIYQITVEDSSLVFASSASRGFDTCIWSFISIYIQDVYGAYSFENDFTYVDLGDYIIITMPDEV